MSNLVIKCDINGIQESNLCPAGQKLIAQEIEAPNYLQGLQGTEIQQGFSIGVYAVLFFWIIGVTLGRIGK